MHPRLEFAQLDIGQHDPVANRVTQPRLSVDQREKRPREVAAGHIAGEERDEVRETRTEFPDAVLDLAEDIPRDHLESLVTDLATDVQRPASALWCAVVRAGGPERMTQGRGHTALPASVGQARRELLGLVEMRAAWRVVSGCDVRTIRGDTQVHVQLAPLFGIG